MLNRLLLCTFAMALLPAASAPAQTVTQQSVIDAARERAQAPYQAGMEHLRSEAFDAAIKSFQQSIELDSTFDMAYYMLGRTYMMTKSYASAVIALSKCRDLHLAESTKKLLTKQEVQQYRRQRIGEIDDRITDLEAAIARPGTRNIAQMKTEIQMLQERRRQIADAERELTPDRAVPSFVSLALGSAQFRSGNLPEAEKAYRATVAADPKVGEAHSNLAVVYMETGRFGEAEKAIAAAERTGFRVLPALKEELKKRAGR